MVRFLPWLVFICAMPRAGAPVMFAAADCLRARFFLARFWFGHTLAVQTIARFSGWVRA